jgi:nickel superoxide dismutase
MAGAAASMFLAAIRPLAVAHCQVPCGIYDDHARITAMLQDTTTIAKAMDQITELAGKQDAQSFNQASRWVMTKEQHAERIQTTIAQYYLAQRVKAVQPDTDAYDAYLQKLAAHHAVIVAAMRAKQTVDPSAANALRKAIEAISAYYPSHDH